MRASGVAESQPRAEALIQNLAAQSQARLEREMPLETVVAYFQAAADSMGQRPYIQELGREHAMGMQGVQHGRPLQQMLFQAPPELQRALDTERPNIERAAGMKNSRTTEKQGDLLIQEIAGRVRAGMAQPPDAQLVLLQVNLAVGRAQMGLMAGEGTLLDAVAKQGGPLSSVISGLGKTSPAEYQHALLEAYAGRPEKAVRLIRGQLARQQALLALNPWQRYDEGAPGADGRSVQLGFGTRRDQLATLAELNPRSSEMIQLAYEVVLAHRARGAEVNRRISAALAEHPPAAEQRLRWRALRGSIAATELQRAAGASPSATEERELQALLADERELMKQLSDATDLRRVQDKPFDASQGVAALQSSLGERDALLSFVNYRHVPPDQPDFTRWSRRYGAFVLRKSGLSWVPLGDGAALDVIIDRYRRALATPGGDVRHKAEQAQSFHEAFLRPLSPFIDDVDGLLIVADGPLQLVPFEAAHDRRVWLADRYRISYELTERQLLGEHVPRVNASPPLLVSGGNYPERPVPFTAGQRLRREHFPQLPGIDRELRQLEKLLPKSKVLAEDSAGAKLLDLPAPRILHIAAHGVHLPLARADETGERGLVQAPADDSDPAQLGLERRSDAATMSRSALVLQNPYAGDGDGFLTGYEIATANLWGTELVVLSACETGRGHPDASRGVQGLRSAFFTAGANSLVTSLWTVDDSAAPELMQQFYSALLGGSERADALRHASYVIRQRHPDPHLWAPFVLIGQRAALSLEGQAPDVAGEDAESRFRRALQHRRIKHSNAPMGRASWSVGERLTEAVDAYVARPVTTPAVLHINLLGRASTLSVSAREYVGPGKYTASAVLMQAPVDPLVVDLAKIHHAGSVLDVGASELVVTKDNDTDFAGYFVIHIRDGQAIRGKFELASALPPVPPWMLRSMRGE